MTGVEAVELPALKLVVSGAVAGGGSRGVTSVEAVELPALKPVMAGVVAGGGRSSSGKMTIEYIKRCASTGGDEDKVEPDYQITHRVYLDVDIEEQRLGRIVIELYGQVVPKTVENFRALCTGEKGTGTNGKPLQYKGTPFHRIASGFVIQGSDVVSGDGKGYESIYGGKLPDENFEIKHSHAGTISMVNTGPDSNGSQFFITTVKASWLDGEHVVFGKVIQGMDTVYAIEGGAGTYSGKPRKKVVIADSGEIPESKWDEER